MYGAVGLSKKAVEEIGDFVALCRFNKDGYIDALSGSNYISDSCYLTMRKEIEYIVEIIGDVTTKLYYVNVEKSGAGKVRLATDCSFKTQRRG